jgi:hypothetical protein
LIYARYALILLAVFSAPSLARAQEVCPDSTDLNDCLNFRVKKVLGAKTEQNGNTKQTETPSVSDNSTSLVDESSAPDLVGVAFNLAGLSASSNGEDEDTDSISVTATAYSLYSKFKGFDPLNPHYYNKHRNWRRLSLTLGYDEEDKPDGSGGKQRAKIFGVKYLVINRRDPNRSEFLRSGGPLDNLFNQLQTATASFGGISNRTRAYLFRHPEVLTNIVVPEFNDFLGDVGRDVNAGAAAARRVADAAQAASTSPAALTPNSADNARAVASEVEAAVVRELPAGVPRRVRSSVEEVSKATRDAAGETGASAVTVADAAQAAATRVEAEARAANARIVDLRTQATQGGIGSLFKFENGFAIQSGPRAWTREEQEYFSAFVSKYGTGEGFGRLRGMIGPDMIAHIDAFIESELKSFESLENASLDAIQAITKAPQLSVAYFTTQRDIGDDEHKGEVIFDWGIADRFNLTLNGAFEYKDSQTLGGDTRVGGFGAKLKYQVNRDKFGDLMNNRKPIFFDLAAEGKWGNGLESIVKAQAKLTFPIGNSGLELPLSLTVANRSELIDEREVKGQFGFTFDFSKLVKALAPAVIPR